MFMLCFCCNCITGTGGRVGTLQKIIKGSVVVHIECNTVAHCVG